MRTTLSLLLFATALAAQKLPLPDAGGRLVQVFDVAKLVPLRPKEAPTRVPQIPGAAADAPARDPLPRIVDCLRRFLEPALGPDDDLKGLGDRRLVLLGTPEQARSLERLLQAATAQSERLIDVQLQFFTVTDKDFQDQLAKRLPAVERGSRVTREAVVDKAVADELRTLLEKLASGQIDAPCLTVRPLDLATIGHKNQTAYIKDFTIASSGESFVAEPVVDVVWDGNESEVVATFLPDGSLGVSCSVMFQELEKPIATFDTKIGPLKTPVTIQLPSLTVMRMQQTATLQDGGLVALATRRISGDWLVALVHAGAHPK